MLGFDPDPPWECSHVAVAGQLYHDSQHSTQYSTNDTCRAEDLNSPSNSTSFSNCYCKCFFLSANLEGDYIRPLVLYIKAQRVCTALYQIGFLHDINGILAGSIIVSNMDCYLHCNDIKFCQLQTYMALALVALVEVKKEQQPKSPRLRLLYLSSDSPFWGTHQVSTVITTKSSTSRSQVYRFIEPDTFTFGDQIIAGWEKHHDEHCGNIFSSICLLMSIHIKYSSAGAVVVLDNVCKMEDNQHAEVFSYSGSLQISKVYSWNDCAKLTSINNSLVELSSESSQGHATNLSDKTLDVKMPQNSKPENWTAQTPSAIDIQHNTIVKYRCCSDQYPCSNITNSRLLSNVPGTCVKPWCRFTNDTSAHILTAVSALGFVLRNQEIMLSIILLSLLASFDSFRVSNALNTASGLTFELPDNEVTCFQEDFEGSQSYLLEYRVIAGGNYDVDVTLESPNGKVLYKEKKKEHDSFKFETSWGSYKLCFSNEFSTVTHKKIYFNLRPEHHDLLSAEGGKKAPSADTFIESSMEKIHSSCTTVMHYQTQYRLNEAKGRHAAETLNMHVQWWSLSQSMVILVTGIGQVFTLKRFFTDHRQSNPLLTLSGHQNTPVPSF